MQRIDVSAGTLVKIVVVFGLAALLFYLSHIVILVITALVIASGVEPGVRLLMRRGFSRTSGVLLIYAVTILSLVSVFYFLLPPLVSDIVNFLNHLPKYIDAFKASDAFASLPFIDQASARQALQIENFVAQVQSGIGDVAANSFLALGKLFGSLANTALVLVLSCYFALQEGSIKDFLRIITPESHETYVLSLWERTQHKIGLWMQGHLVLMFLIGTMTYLGLMVLGVKYALLLAIIAGLAEFIPVFGPIIAAVPALLIAVTDGGATMLLLTLGLYVIINQFENNLIYPLVVTKIVGVPPLITIIALIIGLQLAGLLGAVLAIPFAAALQEFVKDLEEKKVRL